MGNSTTFEKAGECLYVRSVYLDDKLDSKTYYALVKVRGKQFKSSLKTDNLAEARRKLKDYRNDIGRIDPNRGKITIEGLADLYLATIQHQAPGTIQEKTAIAQRIKDKWGPLQAKDIKNSQVKAWLASLKFKRGKGTGKCSRNKYLGVIRAMFQLAVDDRILAHSPAEGLREQKLDTPIRKTPSVEEFKAIVESIRAQPFSDTAVESSDLVEFYGLAGLGMAEASALTWGDVNFKKGQLITFRHKTTTGFPVPLFPQLRPLLEKRYGLAKAANGGKAPSPHAKVFTIADAKKAIESACDRLNLPSYTSRSFRRTFITKAIEAGVDVKVIAQWQGHKDGGKLILSTYSHVRPVHSEQMAKLMTDEKPDNVIPMEGAA